MLQLINDHRIKNGRKPLNLSEQLVLAAQIRAEETVENFSHTRPDGTLYSTVFNEINYSYQGMSGENIASNSFSNATPEDIANQLFNQWVNSPGHNENMLRPEFSEFGFNYVISNGSVYGVQLFSGDPVNKTSEQKDTDSVEISDDTDVEVEKINTPATKADVETSEPLNSNEEISEDVVENPVVTEDNIENTQDVVAEKEDNNQNLIQTKDNIETNSINVDTTAEVE